MAEADPQLSLEKAFERIEETILPSLSLVHDTLLEAASLARPGQDAAVYAAELRTIALQLETLVGELESLVPLRRAEAARSASAA